MDEHVQKALGYGSGLITSVLGLVTLNTIALVVGIFVSIGTLIVTAWLAKRRDRREELVLKYRFGEKQDRREIHAPVKKERREQSTTCATCPYNYAEE